MSKDKDVMTIYWAPAYFTNNDSSWDLLYSEPESVFHTIIKNNDSHGRMPQCPAIKDFLTNTFIFKSTIDDKFEMPLDIMKEIANTEQDNIVIPTDSRLRLTKLRKTSFNDHINVQYNMGWIFYSSEPVMAEFTAPFFPANTPVNGALLSPGSFNIGSWFRPYNLDYHIPLSSKEFSISEGDPLFYLRILTNKRVQFKRFVMSSRLANLSDEMSQSSLRYGRFKKLEEKYAMFKNAKMGSLVMSEIQKNIIKD